MSNVSDKSVSEQPSTRGGARKGAGRPSNNPLTERLNMRVDVGTRRVLAQLGDGNMQAGLRELIRRYGDVA